MSSQDEANESPATHRIPSLEDKGHLTPVKDRRSTSISSIKNSMLHRRENLPDIHMTPSTSRVTTSVNDDKLGKDFVIAKVRSQNELLKKQVKDLNNKLNVALVNSSATKFKPKTELSQNPSNVAGDDLVKKQLQNAYKQLENYKKQLQWFTNHPDGLDYYEKIKRLEDLVAEKNSKLEEVMIENKVLERINRDQDKELDTYRNTTGYEKKINTYLEENRCLREKINNMQAINRHNEHSFKKQQEHVVTMTRQYRLVCEKIGISPSLNFSRAEELDKIMTTKKKPSSRAPEEIAQDFEEAYNTKDSNSLLYKKVVQIKGDRSSSVKSMNNRRSSSTIQNLKEFAETTATTIEGEESYKKQIETLNTRIYMLESEKRQIKHKLRENDKKVVTSTKVNPEDVRKSIIKHRSLSRINLPKNSDVQRSSMNYSGLQESSVAPSKSDLDGEIEQQHKYIPAKMIEDVAPQEQKPEPEKSQQKAPLLIVRKATGGRLESGLSEFNDKEYLPTPLKSKITKLMVWLDENFIYGIQAFYKVQDSYYVAGEEHLGIEMKRKAKFVSSIEVENDDQIWWISGKYEEGLTYLKVKTVKGHIKEFGTKTDSPNEFKISVDPNENMTLLHGAFYYKKGDEKGQDAIILANVGFTLVKETTH